MLCVQCTVYSVQCTVYSAVHRVENLSDGRAQKSLKLVQEEAVSPDAQMKRKKRAYMPTTKPISACYQGGGGLWRCLEEQKPDKSQI